VKAASMTGRDDGHLDGACPVARGDGEMVHVDQEEGGRKVDRTGFAGTALTLALGLAGCFVRQDPGTTQPQAGRPQVITTPVGRQATQPVAPTGRAAGVQFVNATGREVCFLFVSPVTTDSWGVNRLAGGQTLPTGASVTAALESGDFRWDLLAQDCAEETVAEVRNQALPSNGIWTIYAGGGMVGQPDVEVAPPVAGGARVAVSVVNRTGQEICYLYVSPAGAERGSDRLGEETTMAPGTSFDLALDGSVPRWDLMAEDCDDAVLSDERDMPLPRDGVWVVQLSDDYETAGGEEEDVGGEEEDVGGRIERSADEEAYVRAAAAAYLLGGPSYSEELATGTCGAIDNADLRNFCSGDCGLIDNADARNLCDGDCGLVDNADLRNLCTGDCGLIDDSRIRRLCELE
jgi:hypothetical protein